MLGIVLALSSSLSWGLADFLGGLQAKRLTAFFVVAGSQAAGLVAVGIAVVLFAGGMPDAAGLAPAAAAGVFGVIGLGCFYRALSIGTMSVVAPVAASGAVLPVAVGLIGGDEPSALQGAGMLLAFAGVLLVTRETPSAEPLQRAVVRRSILLALVAAVALGTFAIGLDASAGDEPLWAAFAVRIGALALLLPACLLLRSRLKPQGRALPALALVGVLDAGANVLFAYASTEGLLSVVAILGSLYPVVTVALAHVVLHERVRTVQRAGMAAVFGGVLLLAAG